MWKQKLGLGILGLPGMSVADEIRAMRKVGFEAFFTGWSKGDPVEEWAKVAAECGMIYQSIHAPFGRAADIWGADDEKGNAAVAELCDCLDACRRAGVPIMVAHAFIGFKDHSPTEIGLTRFERVVRHAEKRGVKIALENTEGIEYLDALLAHFKDNKTVGFCWDTGHEMCYNYSEDLLARWGDRLLATHVNDNLGIRDVSGEITWIDDLHLLPFDGIGDFSEKMARLARARTPDVLTFELSLRSKPDRRENAPYARMEPIDYLTACYIRACRVGALLIRARGNGHFDF
ncbi:MAG: sugar phosphate isomerase/epimerase [Clostridia bacterium]|nr:sugar phosphate isomerase/epimerase [Clostridia bacterium]